MDTDIDDGCRLDHLEPLTLNHQSIFNQAFARLAQPLSDYSFANLWVWGSALRLSWARLDGHLCVFANGDGDLALLMPPIPEPGATAADLDRALGAAFAILDRCNADPTRSRIEYVSDEMLERIRALRSPWGRLAATPMSGDYVYPVTSMIDLAGKALKSKRHSRNNFLRDQPRRRVEQLAAVHLDDCRGLLARWKDHADAIHAGQVTEDEAAVATAVLRARETSACALALEHHAALGLVGLVVYCDERLAAFTLGERLSASQASILIEKCDPAIDGSAQFIFSEFCRRCWAHCPEINVGDDWGIPTLRATKQSYRPTRRLAKYVLRRAAELCPRRASVTAGPVGQPVTLRPAGPADIAALVRIERACFTRGEAFTRRQVQDLVANPRIVCTVAEQGGRLLGWSVVMTRRHREHLSGRLYNLAVDPGAQGGGLGRVLLDDAIATLTCRGVRSMYLEVACDNAGAIGLYERRGFQCVRVLRDYFATGIHALSMRLILPASDPQAAPPPPASSGRPVDRTGAVIDSVRRDC